MGRSPCCDDVSGLKKGPWTPEEDELLTSYIEKNGLGRWRAIPKAAGLNRCGKSCRLRWTNYLRPGIKRGRFTKEEEDMIIKLHSVLGNKWSRIAAHLPARTDNEIKNYWNTHLRKKLLQMGIDPVTHKPRTELNILANLSQLFTTPQNLLPLMNPWDINNNSLRLQPNVAELAKLHVLQNIFQILNTSSSSSSNNSLPNNNIGQTSIPSNLGMIPNFNASLLLGNININNICSTSQGLNNHVPNNGPSHVTSDKYGASLLDSLPSLEDAYINNNKNDKSSLSGSYETLDDESKLPFLIESNTNSTNASSSSCSSAAAYAPLNGDFFEGLEKLLDDGNTDFWKEFII